MNHRFKLAVALAIFGAIFLSPMTRASEISDKAQIEQVENSWVTATIEADKPTLDQVLHPDFVQVTENGQIQDKAGALAAHKAVQGYSQQFSSLRIRVHGDTGVVTGVVDYRVSPGSTVQQSTFTDVFVRGGPRGWQVLSSQGTQRR
ncbi:nuclear transport factor 2 family protein [Paraburkholderia silviterrae]|uniref:Nuclear transport factor 2 family protein n=1 Tax=Paraburkholderia silviterrae TaxID=2528715 RepID=A0A4R5M8W3_9BURK|nr:nuclear transport factor 2 family protein [Paraburkholderia silviterrae]TDG22365.1 nuclear transport factor 2 family protein [Paraburkholderia silviterrae]